MTTSVDAIATKLAAAVTSRTVFTHATPNVMGDGTPVPTRYLLVRGAVGDERSAFMCDESSVREPIVTVTSVSAHEKPEIAAREAAWGAQAARDALRGFIPTLGRMAWKCEPIGSLASQRDDALKSKTYFAVEKFLITYQE